MNLMKSKQVLAIATLVMGIVLPAAGVRFQAEHVFELEFVANPLISPDGTKVLYERRAFDIMSDRSVASLWLHDLDRETHEPVIADGTGFGSVAWANASDRIAFSVRGEARQEVRVLTLDRRLAATIAKLDRPASQLVWSPDDEQLAFVMSVESQDSPLFKPPKKPKGAVWAEAPIVVDEVRYQFDGRGIVKPSYRHLFVVPSRGGTARQLTTGDFNHSSPVWAASGELVYFSANRHENWALETVESDLFSVNLNGDLEQLTQSPGAETQPQLSADGKRLLYLKEDNEPITYRQQRAVILELATRTEQVLEVGEDASVDVAKWSGNRVAIQIDQRGMRKVLVQGSRGFELVSDQLGGESLGRPYISGRFDVMDGVFASTEGTVSRPADLVLRQKGRMQQVTNVNEDVLGRLELAKVETIRYPSAFDGTEIEGWVLYPPEYEAGNPYPLILELHGGPHLAYGPHFSAELQLTAAAGYVVFYDNYRGSSSYGKAFGNLLQGKYSSEADFQDHMSGIDLLINQGIADADNLFICGGSAGGIATAYAIGLTDRFKAAVAAKPVINWLSKTLTADSYVYQIRHQFTGPPWERFDEYWQRSPLSLVGNVTTPTMLITGEEDRRTPISETEQFYQALKLRGVDSVMVRLPDSAHGIASRPSRLINKVGHTLAWFERYRTSRGDLDSGEQ